MNFGDTPPNVETNTDSPAVGAGSTSLSCSVGWCDPNGSSPSSIYGSTDFLGNPRTNGSSIDIGAYQNTGNAISNSMTVNLTSGASTLQYGQGQSTTLTVTVTALPGVGGAPSGTVNLMLSSDKDFAQIVGERIQIMLPPPTANPNSAGAGSTPRG